MSGPSTLLRVVFLALGSILGCADESGVPSSWPNKRFSTVAWKAAGEARRYELTRDLVTSRTLLGRTAAQVRELLGEPDVPKAARLWTYTVFWDPEVAWPFAEMMLLDVDFDDVGRVSAVSVRPE